ncbi:hypothetical protein CDL12_05746 [Handroanthus impetiginosus]|uniref:PGG domain-containing protein n=1 Tax=Handroanthus impetiginosus TaxID=429701 RepID=A0A2G9HVJ2_9LAMI|nr:hypothetical protein CDL12_05746 [Handroanthus impetiginosus]
MEELETKLFEAAKTGSVSLLRKLLKEDPLILDRVEVNYFAETHLHVAAILGHVDFVKEIIRIKPELTNELNSHRSSPLHLASAKGHLDVVKGLLTVDPQMCLVPIKGRIEDMKMLLYAKAAAAQVMAYRGESILHLSVKHYQLEALKVVVNTAGYPEFINSRDSDGNTVLHLSVADKQVEIIQFLLAMAALEVNALNINGMTAIDLLIQSRRDVRDSEIEESLKCAGAFGTSETNIPLCVNQNMQKNSWKRLVTLVKQQEEWFDKTRGALMVVASLIATMAFQVSVSPLGNPLSTDLLDRAHLAGFSIMAQNSPRAYTVLHIYNTINFIASLSIILLLMSGLTIRRRSFMWILMVITWIAISANAIAYMDLVLHVTPIDEAKSAMYVIQYSLIAWLVLMALLLIGHTIRLILKLVKKLRKRY